MSVYEKLLKIQVNLNAPRSKYNKFGGYNYRSCEDILEAVKPLLKEVNATLFLTDDVIQIAERIYVKATAKFVDIDTGESVENTALNNIEESRIKRKLKRLLTPNQYKVIHNIIFEDKPQNVISRENNISRQAVNNTLYWAKKKLKKSFNLLILCTKNTKSKLLHFLII